jgi:flavorubredoxin
MPTRVAVIYYSATGNVHEIADAIAEGAREEGADPGDDVLAAGRIQGRRLARVATALANARASA